MTDRKISAETWQERVSGFIHVNRKMHEPLTVLHDAAKTWATAAMLDEIHYMLRELTGRQPVAIVLHNKGDSEERMAADVEREDPAA